MLKVETKMVHRINYGDWDRLVQERFPNCPYDCIVSEEEMGNDTTWTCSVKGDLNEEEIAKIEAYLFMGKVAKYAGVYTVNILDYLVHKGELEEGYYNISISW